MKWFICTINSECWKTELAPTGCSLAPNSCPLKKWKKYKIEKEKRKDPILVLSCSESLSLLVDVSLPFCFKYPNECKRTHRAWKSPLLCWMNRSFRGKIGLIKKWSNTLNDVFGFVMIQYHSERVHHRLLQDHYQ